MLKAALAGGPALLLATLFVIAGPASADAEKGRAALEAGDFKTALGELTADAAKGDVDAMFILSRLYAEGKATTQDLKASFEWMEKAAKAGSVRASGTIAMYYSEGIGTARDDAKSLEWGRRAAEGGDAISQFIMGMRLSTGTGVARDPAQAVTWWTRAAERGMARAQIVLANALAQSAAAPNTPPPEASAQRVEAAKWLLVADANNLPGAESLLPTLREKMSPAEIRAAEDKARDWKPAGAAK
jgi:TPR repeat protein